MEATISGFNQNLNKYLISKDILDKTRGLV
jgi:hypothetical protein